MHNLYRIQIGKEYPFFANLNYYHYSKYKRRQLWNMQGRQLQLSLGQFEHIHEGVI